MKDSFFKNFASGVCLMAIIFVWGIVSINNEVLVEMPTWIASITVLLIVGPKALEFYADLKGLNTKTDIDLEDAK